MATQPTEGQVAEALAKQHCTVAIDFDGVLSAYAKGWQGLAVIDEEPVPGAIEWLARATERFDVVIYSARNADPLSVHAMRVWLIRHGLSVEALAQIGFPTEKPTARVYLDDRAWRFDGRFPDLDKIAEFEPWNRRAQNVNTLPFTLTRPLVVLDVEATGTDPVSDRVLEVGLERVEVGGSRSTFQWRINPGRPIPPESTAVHGITDTDVADCPWFEHVAHEIEHAIEGCDLAGFNLRKFDIPILKHEFRRVGRVWPCNGAKVIDGYVIFRDREPRDLSAAVRLYAGHEHHGAHSAVGDARATLEVIAGQLARYPDLPRDLAELDRASGGRQPDWATECGSLRYNAGGDVVIAFGSRNVGLRLIDADNGLLHWILGRDLAEDVKGLVDNVLAGLRPRAPWAAPLPEPDPFEEGGGEDDYDEDLPAIASDDDWERLER